jgi:hypothetical protein
MDCEAVPTLNIGKLRWLCVQKEWNMESKSMTRPPELTGMITFLPARR